MDTRQLAILLNQLTSLPTETEWVEFKHNFADPGEIGEYLSALSNSAALVAERAGFMVWGIEDGTHNVIGTTFKPREAKVGNQEWESWLVDHLTPRLDIRIHEGTVEGKDIVIFEIPAARHTPIRFKETEFIRIGSYKKKLKDYPEKERALWSIFETNTFEKDIALAGIGSDEVLTMLDYPAYFDMTHQLLPENRAGILNRLAVEQMVIERQGGQYDITNLGAILFAKDLNLFGRLARKALRVVIYRGKNRIETVREMKGSKGYAIGYEGAISYINDQLPMNEQIGQALRSEVCMFPEIAIRELVANALIHQDFSISGAGPMVEIFSDRIEFTNPGVPIIDPLRFIDQPPRSRNEEFAAFMRRINICEERGSGIDKVIAAVEVYQLPPPDFRVSGDNTITVLYAYRKLSDMDQFERIRACYQHACLCYVSSERMTNTSLRKRFAIEARNYPMASRIISDAIKAELIRIYDPDGAKSQASYVPFWA